jgi:serine/threonine-protein phosphatase PGAM5
MAIRFALGVSFGCAASSTFYAQQVWASRAEAEIPTSTTSALPPFHERLPTPWDFQWDKPTQRGFPFSYHSSVVDPKSGSPLLAKAAPKAERQLILIRHGQYENEDSKDDSIRKLTPMGEQQATLTGAYLAKSLKPSPLFVADSIDKFYVSNLMRARQTADLIHKELRLADNSTAKDKKDGKPLSVAEIVEDSMLRERFPCDPVPPLMGKKASAESNAKVEAAFEKYFHRPTIAGRSSTEVMVCHANIIRYFVCRALQLPPEAWLRITLPHCSLTTLHMHSDGTVRLTMLGSVTHLPGELHSVRNLP